MQEKELKYECECEWKHIYRPDSSNTANCIFAGLIETWAPFWYDYLCQTINQHTKSLCYKSSNLKSLIRTVSNTTCQLYSKRIYTYSILSQYLFLVDCELNTYRCSFVTMIGDKTDGLSVNWFDDVYKRLSVSICWMQSIFFCCWNFWTEYIRIRDKTYQYVRFRVPWHFIDGKL